MEINHIAHYYNDGFFLTWEFQLPFRACVGDDIHSELMNPNLLGDKQKDFDRFDTFLIDNGEEWMVVDRCNIDHNGNIVVWFKSIKE